MYAGNGRLLALFLPNIHVRQQGHRVFFQLPASAQRFGEVMFEDVQLNDQLALAPGSGEQLDHTNCGRGGPGPAEIGSPPALESQGLNNRLLFHTHPFPCLFWVLLFSVSTIFLPYWPVHRHFSTTLFNYCNVGSLFVCSRNVTACRVTNRSHTKQSPRSACFLAVVKSCGLWTELKNRTVACLSVSISPKW